MPGKSVSCGRAFRQHIPVLAKRNRPPADSRYAACRPQLTASQGTQVERQAILARTRCTRCADGVHGSNAVISAVEASEVCHWIELAVGFYRASQLKRLGLLAKVEEPIQAVLVRISV